MKLMRQLISLFIDFLFPKTHLVRKLEAMESDTLIKTLQESSVGTEAPLHDIQSLFAYRNENVHALIHEIKYGANRTLALRIAPALYNKCKEMTFGFPAVITFIPQSQNRKVQRGFDQGSIVLSAIKNYEASQQKDRPLFTYSRELLIWNRKVNQQSATASKEERIKNVEFALTCADQLSVRNRQVIVLDDVCTTGATLLEAKRALEEVGAAKVHLLAIAH